MNLLLAKRLHTIAKKGRKEQNNMQWKNNQKTV